AVSDRVNVDFYARYFRQDQESPSFSEEEGTRIFIDDNIFQQDYSINPSVSVHISQGTEFTFDYFYSTYQTERELTYSKSGNLFEKEVFDQFYQKGNAQLTKLWNIKNISTLGLGVNRQSITADRFPDT